MPRLTRKEARIERAASKQLAHEAKKVRLLELPSLAKEVRLGQAVEEETKLPRTDIDPLSYRDLRMTWCITKADVQGQWSWGQLRQWNDAQWNQSITATLHQMEQLTWKEIEAQRAGKYARNHPQSVSSLVLEAQNRWVSLDIETDQAYRFRLSARERAWGYRLGRHFYLVWYGEQHQIYPVDLKGT